MTIGFVSNYRCAHHAKKKNADQDMGKIQATLLDEAQALREANRQLEMSGADLRMENESLQKASIVFSSTWTSKYLAQLVTIGVTVNGLLTPASIINYLILRYQKGGPCL